MEEGSMETGLLLTRSFLIDEAKLNNHSGGGDCSSIDETESCVSFGVLLSTFVAVCGSFCYGYAMGYSSAAMSGITEDLGLSVADYSLFASIMNFGGIIGAIFSGKIAALIGRRQTMWFSQIFLTLGWLAIAFAKDVWWLDAGRLSLGIGFGFVSYVVPIYISEITPKNIRGRFIFTNQLMQNCGISFIYITGNFIHWHILAFIGLIPCVMQVIGLFFIPESPRWLAKFGREIEFKDALQRLRRKNADISQEAADIRDSTGTFEQDQKAGILDLFQRRYAKLLIVGVGLMLLQQLTGSGGMAYYASTIFEKADFSTGIGTTTLALIMIPKALLGLILVDKWGRRPLLIASSSGMCLSCFLLGTSFSLQALNLLKELTPLFAYIGVLAYITTFAMGMGGLPWIIMSEIFPIDVKVSAGSLVTITNWSMGWIVTYIFNFMFEWNSAATFFIYSSICGATIVFVWMFVPETKGLTLEEIQTSLTHHRH